MNSAYQSTSLLQLTIVSFPGALLGLTNSSVEANKNKPETLSAHNLTLHTRSLEGSEVKDVGLEVEFSPSRICTFTVVNVERLRCPWRQTKMPGGVLEARSSTENPLT